MVDRNFYFSLMASVSNVIGPIMVDILESISSSCPGEIYRIMKKHVGLRATSNRPQLRPFIFLISAALTEIKEMSGSMYRLAAITELLNISTYMSNLTFDKKGNYITKKDAQLLIMASIILKDAAFEEIRRIDEIDDYVLTKVFHVLARGYREVIQGQFIDLFEMSRRQEYNDYLRTYVKRCRFLGGGSLEAICEGGSISANLDRKKIEALKMFGRFHGLALQIVNDIADFVPVTSAARSVGKISADRYSDLKNGRITLPLYLAYKNGTATQKQELKEFSKPQVTISEERLLNIMKSTKAFEVTISVAQQADNIAKRCIESLNGLQRDVLRSSLKVSCNNRFYKYLAEVSLENIGVEPDPVLRTFLQTHLD